MDFEIVLNNLIATHNEVMELGNNFYAGFEVSGEGIFPQIELHTKTITEQINIIYDRMTELTHPRNKDYFESSFNEFKRTYQKTYEIIEKMREILSTMNNMAFAWREEYLTYVNNILGNIFINFLNSGALIIEQHPPQVLKTNT